MMKNRFLGMNMGSWTRLDHPRPRKTRKTGRKPRKTRKFGVGGRREAPSIRPRRTPGIPGWRARGGWGIVSMGYGPCPAMNEHPSWAVNVILSQSKAPIEIWRASGAPMGPDLLFFTICCLHVRSILLFFKQKLFYCFYDLHIYIYIYILKMNFIKIKKIIILKIKIDR